MEQPLCGSGSKHNRREGRPWREESTETDLRQEGFVVGESHSCSLKNLDLLEPPLFSFLDLKSKSCNCLEFLDYDLLLSIYYSVCHLINTFGLYMVRYDV